MTQGRIAAADGRSNVFAMCRQCALPSRHIGATWRIRLNFCFLQPTRLHNPNGKSISSAVFCRAHYCDIPTDRPTDPIRYSVYVVLRRP